MPISGPDFPPNSVITAIPTPGTTGAITLSTIATNTNAAGTLKFTGKFSGTEDIVSMEVNKGVKVPISVSGGAILRGSTGGVDIIKTLDTLIADINSGNSAGINAANSNIDKANQQLLGAISDVGMRKARMDNALVSQQRNYNVLSEIHDGMQNVDYSKAAIQLTNQKTAFEAALSATAKIAPLSLLNYL
jgi:flagellar hook-associated protein 3 FlgL